MDVSIIIILFLLFPISWLLCKSVIKYTLKKSILDIPNDRSSHLNAKPRGGGLAVVITFLAFVCVMFILKLISLRFFLAFFGGGGLIAYISWIDDRKNGLSIKTRLLVQFMAAIWSVYWLQGLPQLSFGINIIPLGFFGTLLSIIGILWVTNLYNFMDGIDGLAASEAVNIGIFAGCLLLIAGTGSLASISFALALSSLGFLVWNWPPSKIFMGDVGSSFLGFIFAVLAIASENNGGVPLVIWTLLLGVFLVDATATLIRRIYLRECWYQAHRSHAYQCATQIGFTHKQVTLAIIFLNIVLAIFALTIWYYPCFATPIIIVAFLGLLIIHFSVYNKWKYLIKKNDY